MIEKLGDQYKMVEYLERLIDLYEKHRCFIFYLICLLAICVIVLYFLNTNEDCGYKIRKKGQFLFAAILDGGIGILVHKLGVFQFIEYAWFDAMFFIMILSAISLYMTAQMIFYKKIIRPILKNAVYLQYLIFAEVFLLAATNHLDGIECLMVAVAIILIQLMPDALKPLEKKQQEEEDQESDSPNSELYSKRKQQLKNFIPILEQQKKEPYAILISGAWGSGKSSFVKALERQLKDDYFIWIYAGSEKNSSIVMSEISKKIIEILQKNNVYIEQGNLIEEYFEAFSGVLEEKVGYKYLRKIANLSETGVNTENRDYLNEKLRELRGTVYLVIDDLDRCDTEYKEMMFKVIRESTTELTKCKTIFLADEEAFCAKKKQGKEQDKKHYIEKYIGYTLELCKVEYQEICDYYIKIIFGDDALRGLNPILLNGRSANEIRNMICQCPEDILQRYRNECNRIELLYESRRNQGREQDEKYLNSVMEDKEALLARIATVEKNVINSRKVKNFMKGVKRNLENINKGVEKCSQEFQKLDWIQAVIRVQFVINILPELFDQLKQRQDIITPQQEKEMDMLFALSDSGISMDAKKIRVINEVVYNIDIIDFEQMMTEKEQYLGELHGKSTAVDHINEYVKYAESYEDLKKVVKICEEHPSLDRWKREVFLENILDRMEDRYLLIEERKEEFWELSVMLIAYLKNIRASKNEGNICIHKGPIIAEKIISANMRSFQYVLMALFAIEKVEDAWHLSSPSNIVELYRTMKDIDSENMYVGPNRDEDCLIDIRNCCEKMKQELLQEMNIESGIDFEEKFAEIELVLKNYQYWQEIERNIEQIYEDDLSAFNNYFSLYGAAVFHNNVFESIETLVEALTELKKFYVRMAGDYRSEYSKFLESISHELAISPRNYLVQFKDRKAEVANLLTELAGEVSKLNKLKEGEDQFDKKAAKTSLDLIMLYIFKFKKNIEKK